MERTIMIIATIWQELKKDWKRWRRNDVSNRFIETTDKHEPIIIEMHKEHLVELYDFAYEQAIKTGKVGELKEIDRKINGC